LFVSKFEETYPDPDYTVATYGPYTSTFVQGGLDVKVPYDESVLEPLLRELKMESSALEDAIRLATSEQTLQNIRARAHRVAGDIDRITEAQITKFYYAPGTIVRTIEPFQETIIHASDPDEPMYKKYLSAIELRAQHCGQRTVFMEVEFIPPACPHKTYFQEFPCSCQGNMALGISVDYAGTPLPEASPSMIDVVLPALRDHRALDHTARRIFHETMSREAAGIPKRRTKLETSVVNACQRLRLAPKVAPAWMLHSVFSQIPTEVLKKAAAICKVDPKRVRDINAYPALFRDAILVRDDAISYIENDLEKELKTKAFLPVSYADIVADKKVKVGYPKIIPPKEPSGLPSLEGEVSVSFVPLLYREEADTLARKANKPPELLRKYMSVNRDVFYDLLSKKSAIVTDLEFLRKEDSVDAFLARRNALPKGSYQNLPEHCLDGLIVKEWVRKFMHSTAVDRSYDQRTGRPLTHTLSIDEKISLIVSGAVTDRNWESKLPTASRSQKTIPSQGNPQRRGNSSRGSRGRGYPRQNENTRGSRRRQSSSGGEESPARGSCWECGKTGHRASRCPQLLGRGYSSEDN
jgi:hypothetical protein